MYNLLNKKHSYGLWYAFPPLYHGLFKIFQYIFSTFYSGCILCWPYNLLNLFSLVIYLGFLCHKLELDHFCMSWVVPFHCKSKWNFRTKESAHFVAWCILSSGTSKRLYPLFIDWFLRLYPFLIPPSSIWEDLFLHMFANARVTIKPTIGVTNLI